MKFLVVLAALLGVSLGFQPGYQYQYRYNAKVDAGLPEIRHRYSIMGLKANVLFQVKSLKQVIVTVSDLQEARSIQDTVGGMHGYMNLEYKPASKNLSTLMIPYTVNYEAGKDKEPVLIVDSKDVEWQRNMRKAIVSLVKPFNDKFKNMFTDSVELVMEDSLYGECETAYTATPLQHQDFPFDPSNNHQYLEPKICKEKAYNVSRVINFDQCNDQSMVQTVGVGNQTLYGTNQEGSFESRASQGFFVICGPKSEEYFEIFNATAYGSFVSNPFGFETEKIQSNVNQTMTFLKKEPLKGAKSLPKEQVPVKTWKFEVHSPFKSGENPPEWVNFYGKTDDFTAYTPEAVSSGMFVHPELRNTFKDRIIKNVNNVATLLNAAYKTSSQKTLYDNPYSEAADQLSSAAKMAKALPKEDLEYLYKKLVSASHKNTQTDVAGTLFLDIMASSGSSPAYDILLDHMGKDISPTRTKSIYFTLTNSLANPQVLEKFMNALTNLKFDDNSYTTTTAFVNYANTLRRLCADRYSPAFAVPQPILGSAVCKSNQLVPKFINLVEDRLKAAKSPYEKSVLAETLGNFGSTEGLPLLKQIMDGAYGNEPSVRTPAVYALLRERMPSAPVTEVAKQLYRIIDNYQEDPQLRQAAVLVYLSWEPTAEFYKRIAQMTWRDPSNQMSSFIYSLLHGMSNSNYADHREQSQYATHALRTAKPHAPSVMYSYAYLWARYLPQESLNVFSALNIVHGNDSGIPREATAFLYNSYGGLDYSPFMQAVSAYHVEDIVYKILGYLEKSQNASPNPNKMNRKAAGTYVNFEQLLKNELKFNGDELLPYQFFFVTRLFQEMEFFAPVDEQILSKLPNFGRKWMDVLLEGTTLQIVKFLNPSSNENYFPNEMGLPVFHRVQQPIVFSLLADAKMKTTHPNKPSFVDLLSANETSVELDAKFKFFSNYEAAATVLFPWDQKAMSAATKSYRGACLPVRYIGSLSANLTFGQINRTMFSYFEPTYKDRFQLYHSHNIPYVSFHGMWPGDETDQAQMITVQKDLTPLIDVQKVLDRSLTGFESQLNFKGDAEYPFTRGFIIDVYKNPGRAFKMAFSPAARHWDMEVVVNFSSQETKSVNASLSFWVPSTVVPETNANFSLAVNSNPDRIEDFRAGCTTRIHLNGTRNRFYEISAATSKQFDEYKTSKSVTRINFHRSALPGAEEIPACYCWQGVVNGPNPYDTVSLKKVFNSQREFTFNLNGEFWNGEQCQDNSVATVTGEATMTKPLVDIVDEVITEAGEWTPEYPGEPFFDVLNFTIGYQPQKVSKELQNFTYHLHDAFIAYTAPYFVANYMNVKNPPGQIDMNANRLIGSPRWEISLKMPTENLYAYHQLFPHSLYNVIPSPGAETEEHQCIVSRKYTRSSDGKRVEYNPYVVKDCYVVTAVNRRHPTSFQVLTRQNNEGKLQAMIASNNYKLNVEFDYESLKVNGNQFEVTSTSQVINGGSMGTFCHVVKQNNKMEVVVPGNFTVYASQDFIEVYPYQELQSSLGGLCGDFNSEDRYDSVGPQHCVYKDAEMFASSWLTTGGDHCDHNAVESKAKLVQEFQKNCQKVHPYSSNKNPFYQEDKDCLQFIYPIKTTSEGYTCVSDSAMGYCMPKCKLTKDLTLQQSYSCWTPKMLPADVKFNSPRGYMKSPPTVKAQFSLAFTTKSAFGCHHE